MTKLILFTGKGGVGKSTSSAATAPVSRRQGIKTLLVSSILLTAPMIPSAQPSGTNPARSAQSFGR